MRTVRKGDKRKNEILDKAEILFTSKGFEQTTVVDILEAVDIGKGTFYYHYKSKEEVLDAIIERRCALGVEAALRIAGDDSLGVHEKLLRAMLAQKPANEAQKGINAVLHEPSNALMHQKCMTEIVSKLSPVLQIVVEQGIAEGVFSTPWPRETMEFVLATAMTIFDDGYFTWTSDELVARMHAFLFFTERALGAEEGSLAYLAQCFDPV